MMNADTSVGLLTNFHITHVLRSESGNCYVFHLHST